MSTWHKRFLDEVALGAVTAMSGNAFHVGRRMVELQSSKSRISIELKSNRSCNHRLNDAEAP